MKKLENLQERLNDNPNSFILTEALRIYVNAENQENEIKALEILERAAQQY